MLSTSKPVSEDYVNAGFFVFEPQVFDFVDHGLRYSSRSRWSGWSGLGGELMAYRARGLLAANGHVPRVHLAQRHVGGE